MKFKVIVLTSLTAILLALTMGIKLTIGIITVAICLTAALSPTLMIYFKERGVFDNPHDPKGPGVKLDP